MKIEIIAIIVGTANLIVEGAFLGMSIRHGHKNSKRFDQLERVLIHDNTELLTIFLDKLKILLELERISSVKGEDNNLWNGIWIKEFYEIHGKLQSKLTSFEPLGRDIVNLIGYILDKFEQVRNKPLTKSLRETMNLEPLDYEIIFPEERRIQMIDSLLEQIEELKEKLFNTHSIKTIRY